MAIQSSPDQAAASTPPCGVSGSGVLRIAPACNFVPARYGRLAARLTLAAACVVAVAACGSSTSLSATGTTGAASAQISAARCMRAHGVPNFPDPGPSGGMSVNLSSGGSGVTIDGIAFSGPVFEAAEKICNPLGSSGGNPAVGEQHKQALLGYARCMRQHGISQYTDPQFPPGGGIFGGGVSRQAATAPAYKHAAVLCSKTLGSYGAG